MATQVQRRRGTKAQNDAFTGALGEFTFDTETKTIRVHDGSTQGGFALVKANAAVTPGTKCKITYDEQGLVTGGADLELADLPSGLSDVYVLKNAAITPTGEGEYKCKIRYDAKGLVLGGADLEVSDIPTGIPQGKIQNLTSDLAAKMPQIEVKVPANTSGSIQLFDNAVNKVVLTGSATLVSPTVAAGTSGILHQCLVQLQKPDAAYTVSFSATNFFGSSSAPDMSSAGYYNVYYEYDSTQNVWVVGAIKKVAAL